MGHSVRILSFSGCLRRLLGVFVLALLAARPFFPHAAHFGRNTATNADRERHEDRPFSKPLVSTRT